MISIANLLTAVKTKEEAELKSMATLTKRHLDNLMKYGVPNAGTCSLTALCIEKDEYMQKYENMISRRTNFVNALYPATNALIVGNIGLENDVCVTVMEAILTNESDLHCDKLENLVKMRDAGLEHLQYMLGKCVGEKFESLAAFFKFLKSPPQAAVCQLKFDSFGVTSASRAAMLQFAPLMESVGQKYRFFFDKKDLSLHIKGEAFPIRLLEFSPQAFKMAVSAVEVANFDCGAVCESDDLVEKLMPPVMKTHHDL
eukprot:3941933-Karenia_brevis.AAC.1